MKILVSTRQYREITIMIAILQLVESIIKYWNTEVEQLYKNKVKLSKNTIRMLQTFIDALTSSALHQKEKYATMVEQIAKENNYEFNDETIITLVEDELAITLTQNAEQKESDINGME